MDENRNPPAFPTERSEYNFDAKMGFPTITRRSEDGMTLRDYFAAAALTGIISNSSGVVDAEGVALVALSAYGFGDAMLAERAKNV